MLISERQPGVGQFQEGNMVWDNFKKAAWCGTGSNTQRQMCWFQEDSLVWDNVHCVDFRKTAWCGTMPTVLISGRQPGVGQCPLF